MPDTDDLTDELVSEDTRARLRKLEALLHSHGYVKNQHGFWVLPGGAPWLQRIERNDENDED